MFLLGWQKLTDTGYGSKKINFPCCCLFCSASTSASLSRSLVWVCFSSFFPHKTFCSVWRERCLGSMPAIQLLTWVASESSASALEALADTVVVVCQDGLGISLLKGACTCAGWIFELDEYFEYNGGKGNTLFAWTFALNWNVPNALETSKDI